MLSSETNRIGDVLVGMGLVTQAQMREALYRQRVMRQRLTKKQMVDRALERQSISLERTLTSWTGLGSFADQVISSHNGEKGQAA